MQSAVFCPPFLSLFSLSDDLKTETHGACARWAAGFRGRIPTNPYTKDTQANEKVLGTGLPGGPLR